MAKSTVIFKNAHYTACAMADGCLIVTSNRTQRGIRLIGDQAVTWIGSIQTALDTNEAHHLCKAVLSETDRRC